jgi:outer membrane protein assembly factor BamE (lipoprotein component of BamABCDE complex)
MNVLVNRVLGRCSWTKYSTSSGWWEHSDVLIGSAVPFLLALVLSACVIIPTPSHWHGLQSGRGVMTKDEIGSLEIGKTTREEVLLRFGEPSRHSRDGKEFVYSWSVIVGYFVAVSEVSGGAGPMIRDYRVSLEFDEHGFLKSKERKGRFR